MLTTEEEAKTKWCPEVRTGLTAGMAVNHHINGDVDEETRCIGSSCMMWRWLQVLAGDGMNVVDDPKRRGFCGKAGRP